MTSDLSTPSSSPVALLSPFSAASKVRLAVSTLSAPAFMAIDEQTTSERAGAELDENRVLNLSLRFSRVILAARCFIGGLNPSEGGVMLPR